MPYLVLIFSLIYPVYALAFAVYLSIKKNSGLLSIFCIALAFATIAFAVNPSFEYDLYRHYERIQSLRGIPLTSVIEGTRPGYLLFDIFAWTINKLNLPKELFTASIVFVSYYLVFSIYNDIKHKYLQETNQLYILLVFLIFWLSISFVGLTSGLRNPFSNIIMLYLCYNLFLKKRVVLYILGSIVSFLIHPFALVLSIFIGFSYILNRFSSKSKILIMFGFLLTLGSQVVTLGIEYITAIFGNLEFFRPSYFDEESEYGGSYATALNLTGYILLILIPKIPIYLAQAYLLFIKPKANNAFYFLLCLISLYMGFFSSYQFLYSRMANFFLLLFVLYIAIYRLNVKKLYNKYFMLIYLLFLFMYSIVSLYRYKSFHASYLETVAFRPLLLIFFGI